MAKARWELVGDAGGGKEGEKGKKKERKVSHRARGIAVEIEEREGGRKEEGRVDPAPPSSH